MALIAGSRRSEFKWLSYSYWISFYLFLILLNVLPSASKETTSLEDAAKQLAERVSTIPNLRGPLRLEYLGEAAQPIAADAEWKATLRSELEKHRLIVTEESNAPALRVFVTQTPTQIVFTASATIAERQEVRIVAVNRATVPAANLPVAPVRLERQLVYQGADRILDVSSLWNGEEKGLAILLLRNSELLALRLDASGAIKQTVSFTGANIRLPSRSPRGAGAQGSASGSAPAVEDLRIHLEQLCRSQVPRRKVRLARDYAIDVSLRFDRLEIGSRRQRLDYLGSTASHSRRVRKARQRSSDERISGAGLEYQW